MRIKKSEFRQIVKNILFEILREKSELSEINSTANVDGFQTPYAFDDCGEKKHAKKIRSRAEVFDFKSTSNKKKNTLKIDEGKSLFHIFRDTKDYSPEQKLGVTIREVNKLLNEIEKFVNISARFKIEAGVNNDKMWKTTNRYLTKLEDKVNKISNKIKELR